MKLKFRYRLKTFPKFFLFAFYPKTTLFVCFLFTALVASGLLVAMSFLPENSIWYNVLFAVATGAIGSFFVSVVVELSSNYKHNKLALDELQEYFLTIEGFATEKSSNERLKLPSAKNDDDSVEPKDDVELVWRNLPNLMPALKDAFNSKKAFISDRELILLGDILDQYKTIRNQVRMLANETFAHDSLNRPDETFLESVYPQNILDDMDEYTKKELAQKECEKAVETFVDDIMSDVFSLNRFLEGYSICQKSIDNYRFDGGGGDCEEPEFGDPDDAESLDEHKMIIQEQNRWLREKHKPFVNWLLSQSCLLIFRDIEYLEKAMMRIPYVSDFIKGMKKIGKIPMGELEIEKTAGKRGKSGK